MTTNPALTAGRCVIVTTRESPMQAQIMRLSGHLRDDYALECDFAYLEDVFSSSDEKVEQAAFDALVHHLIHAQLAVIDLCVTAAAFYVTGIRHALSNAPNLMMAPNSGTATVANSRFTNTQHTYIDVSKPDWLNSIADTLVYLNQPQIAEYQSDLRATGAFRVSPREVAFEKSRLHPVAWQLNASGNTVAQSAGPKIVLWEHKIQDTSDFDVWVNSENTFMEMARFWDSSVSAQIRKLGAVRRGALNDESFKDALGLALAEKVGTRSRVPIGTVFMTRTDEASTLSKRNHVNYVAHLAAVEPNAVGDGFSSGGEVTQCVSNVFEAVQQERLKMRGRRRDLKSVLFPLIGSGDGGAHPAFVAHQMVIGLRDAIAVSQKDPKSLNREQRAEQAALNLNAISKIGIIAFKQSHLDFLRRELANNDFIEVPLPSGDDA
ncbi:MAG: macro domain-containing protein [Pseudomonadota bacterium]